MMAVRSDWLNAHARLETGKRAAVKLCARCGVSHIVTKKNRLCGPCQADRYDERVAVARIKAKEAKKRPKPPTAEEVAAVEAYQDMLAQYGFKKRE